MDTVIVANHIATNYFVMGRLTSTLHTLQEVFDILHNKYKTGLVVSQEQGEETHKLHFHFVIQLNRTDYTSLVTARESVRKYVKKEFNVQGNEQYSIKQSTNPVNAIAYTIKENNYLEAGISNFFFLIVNHIVMSNALQLLNLI